MAKRLTDTDKWKEPWFCALTPEHKHFWTYLMENCNHAGIWAPNWPLVKFHLCIDNPVNHKVYNDKIQIMSDGNWFIPDFLYLQYPNGLRMDVRPLRSVLHILTQYNLLETLKKGFYSPYERAKDIDIDIDKKQPYTSNGIESNKIIQSEKLDEFGIPLKWRTKTWPVNKQYSQR